MGIAPWAQAAVAPQPDGQTDVLYVANTLYGQAPVSVYGGPKLGLLRTIASHVSQPGYLALDSAGHLYVSNLGFDYPEAVNEFGQRGKTFLRTISHLKRPGPITLDSAGDLYLVRRREVDIYDKTDGRRVLHRIKLRFGSALTVDAAGNLYVAAGTNAIDVYAPGSTTPSRTITDGIFDPISLAVDSAGNLYVANVFGGTEDCGSTPGGTVTVYAPGSESVLYTIGANDGICFPGRLAVDGENNLYVANGPPGTETLGSVTVYAPGGKLLRTITVGINAPDAIALDAAANVFVANTGANTVTEYRSGTSSLLRTISDGVQYPEAIAVGS